MIEFAPDKYMKRMSYQEAILYCWSLVIDGKRNWRLPTNTEIRLSRKFDNKFCLYWSADDNELTAEIYTMLYAIPVRDL